MVTRDFFDTSAIVKRYSAEPGSGWVTQQASDPTRHRIVLSEITLVEVAAALAAKQRAPQGISEELRDQVLALFLEHCTTEYDVIQISPKMVEHAIGLTQRHRLRGCDALQLAAAIAANNILIGAGLPPLTFVAADNDLLSAARGEGLQNENLLLRA